MGYEVAAGADKVKPFFLCEREAALELAAGYEKGREEMLDAMILVTVAERCIRTPSGWSFEVAEIVAGPLTDYNGLGFYVVMIDAGDGQALYTLTWPVLGGRAPQRRPI